jgi:hypothetical protein
MDDVVTLTAEEDAAMTAVARRAFRAEALVNEGVKLTVWEVYMALEREEAARG